ncbi:MAG: cobalamin B12-binding domain-containing protein [Alphaproteobacteria bacterium]|nr:cobalamin B12-binding domain-containing protein [Alphaproteobacteria bacterium]
MPDAFDRDCLLVHSPKADNHYLPFGDFFNITYAPMGLLALAEILRRRGFSTELVHLGVQWLEQPDVSVLDLVEGERIRAIGLSLYWHYQSHDAIQAAGALKARHPEAFVFLGGVTATYFADEILRTFPFVDAVVLGHAESTVPLLLRTLKDGGDVGTVPNLCLRTPDGVVNTRGRPFPAGSVVGLDELVFGDLSVMRDADRYARSFGFPLAYGRDHSPDENRAMLSMGRSFFPLFTGRGCPWQCTFCGGNRDTLKRVNGTSKVQWRAPDMVVDDIRRAQEFGYRTMSLCFDPTPTRDAYYLDLFEKIRHSGLDVDFYFECWGLPTADFVTAFRRTFPSPESYIAISPDAGDEAVRRRNKQPFYTDAEMFETLDRFEAVDLSFDVFFTLALPGEKLPQARRTWELKRDIATRYRNARRVMTWTVQLEPGSPQFERPADFDMTTDRDCFADFYEAHGGDHADTYSVLGFKVADYFGDARDEGGIPEFERHLQHLKCMEFCFLAKDPRMWNQPDAGRRHCMERRRMLAERRGHGAPTVEIGEQVFYEEALAEEQALRGPRPRYRWVPEVDRAGRFVGGGPR